MPTPADELKAAAEVLRKPVTIGAYTATPAGAALLRAREPLTKLLTGAAETVTTYRDLGIDHDRTKCDDFACDLVGHALAAARAILGGDQT